MTVALIVGLLLLIVLNIPIVFAIGLVCLGYLLVKDLNLALLAQRSALGIYSYPFLALPMFVFAGVLMEHGGITKRLMRLANAMVGHVSGGLASVTVSGSAMFGALSGSAIGNTAAVGSIMIPAMREKKYSMGFASALQGCSGVLGSLIPPSLTMVILGATGGISISALLVGGLIPGLLMALSLIVVSILISRRHGYGQGDRASWCELGAATLSALPPLMLPVIVLGGIFGGIVTVTEAAVLAVLYAFILSVFVYRAISVRDMPRVTLQVLKIAVPVQIIVAVSNVFAWIITAERMPQQLLVMFETIAPSALGFLLILMVIVLILGTFMESTALIIILIPILMPVVSAYGIDPVYFGVLFVINLCIGANTPPLGVTLATAARIAGVPFSQAARAVWPFLGAMVFTLLAVLLFPGLATYLPALMR